MNEKQTPLDFNQESLRRKKKRKKLIASIILALLLLLITTVTLHQLGYIRFPWELERMVIGNVQQGNLPGLSDEELLAELQRQADESNVTIQLNSRPVFEDGTGEGSLFLGNPEFNTLDMHVEISLIETDELIYDSGRIPPGYHIAYDKLQLVLEEGTYPALAIVTYYEGDEVRTMTQFKIEIIIKN